MKIELLHSTPLWVCAKAIRKCWASEDKSDTQTHYDTVCEDFFVVCGDKDKELIERVGNKNKHKSTLEHLVYTFDIDGISRACLQELARHRMASYSVKSTRYTLKELKNEEPFLELDQDTFDRAWKYCIPVNHKVNAQILRALENLRSQLKSGVENDIAKYCLPEAYKTSLIMTINARSLQNFLELRSSKYALWEIRELALNIYKAIPEEHKYLFEESINVH